MILKLDVCFLTFLYIINTSHGLFSVRENNLDGYSSTLDRNEITIKDIKKITNNINSEVYYSMQNIETPGRFFKKILIKRIIPHGMKPSGIEYDHKFKTFYKPLIRIHKRKQDKHIKDMNEYEIASIIAKTPRKDLKLKETKNYDIDSEMLKPFKLSKTELTGNEFEVIKNLKNIIKSIESRTQRIKAYDKVIKLLRNMLRSPQFEKSGEMNDPFAPGKKVLPVDREAVTQKNKIWAPHYPPWNYWTYKKTLHQDVCPETQVKLGNICIWTPPH
ncbi:uncharacterized protein LOC126777105 [Nymphalis io]|uniref:uncharacterized protein LOC126777105 n=1 Tax=Inachis io TaxID=171585 RepID=UPI002168887B|nr:uncharacterized protein LOC126777105 [Nymphalis io]